MARQTLPTKSPQPRSGQSLRSPGLSTGSQASLTYTSLRLPGTLGRPGKPWHRAQLTCQPATSASASTARRPDGEELHTAVAQVFNERGDCVVLRGGTAKISKTGRRPHLTEADARKLLNDVLAEYRSTHGHQPAPVPAPLQPHLDRGGAEGDLMELNGWSSPQMLRLYGASARGIRARRN
jgi:hypothetical protein